MGGGGSKIALVVSKIFYFLMEKKNAEPKHSKISTAVKSRLWVLRFILIFCMFERFHLKKKRT